MTVQNEIVIITIKKNNTLWCIQDINAQRAAKHMAKCQEMGSSRNQGNSTETVFLLPVLECEAVTQSCIVSDITWGPMCNKNVCWWTNNIPWRYLYKVCVRKKTMSKVCQKFMSMVPCKNSVHWRVEKFYRTFCENKQNIQKHYVLNEDKLENNGSWKMKQLLENPRTSWLFKVEHQNSKLSG
jgi:hypothetical protein